MLGLEFIWKAFAAQVLCERCGDLLLRVGKMKKQEDSWLFREDSACILSVEIIASVGKQLPSAEKNRAALVKKHYGSYIFC